MLSNLFTTALLAGIVAALPAPVLFKRETQYSTSVEIHASCNTTQRRMIQQGINETFEVAGYARDYILQHGSADPVFQLYFGNKPEAFPATLGVYDAILSSNKAGVLFRCDDPDKNCALPGWRGHYRGSNATMETVICDASYTDRLYNAAFCMHGFQLATTAPSAYWSIDLMHRLLHVPTVTASAVNHYADNLDEALELAIHNSTFSPFDSDAIQYFAAHVYALDVAQGGDSCIGDIHAHDHGAEAAAPSAPASPTAAAPTAAATSKAADCHSHADGTIHCV